MKLIQISDLHFVPPGELLYTLDPRARFEAAIADINENHGDAEMCLLTGDLTDAGAPGAYGQLREALETLSVPYRLLIGNHDHRENFKQAFPEAPCDENGFVQSSVRASAGELILLDTNEPGTHAGHFCAQRQSWLRERLAEARGAPVYLFMHHPPFNVGIPSMDCVRLQDPEGLAETLSGGANIVHLFFGHVHRPISGSWRGIPFSILRSTVHQVSLDFVTVGQVPFDYASPAYNVILIEDGVTVVHHHDYMEVSRVPDAERFTKAS